MDCDAIPVFKKYAIRNYREGNGERKQGGTKIRGERVVYMVCMCAPLLMRFFGCMCKPISRVSI